MSSSPSVLAAATTLASWAHARRRVWSAEPLPRPMPRAVVEPEIVHAAVASGAIAPDAFELRLEEFEEVEKIVEIASTPHVEALPSVSVTDVLLGFVRGGGAAAMTALESIQPLADSTADWLMRGAAVVSTMSVVVLIGVNRGEVFERYDRMAAIVKAATLRSVDPAAPAGPAKGNGRVTIASSDGAAQVTVDGRPRGLAPVTVDLSAGSHRVLVSNEKGSVERVVKIQAGESSEMTEAIFPGWLALTAPIDLTLSEGGRALKRDDRGWAILAPGPHDIQIENRSLGVREARHVVITPGDATRLSFVPQASTISLTTNEPAEVWIDGVAAGETPLVARPIALGLHDVRVRSSLHERWVRARATVHPLELHVELTGQTTLQSDQ